MGVNGSKWVGNGCYGTVRHGGAQKGGTKRHGWAWTYVHVTSMGGAGRSGLHGLVRETRMGCRWLWVDCMGVYVGVVVWGNTEECKKKNQKSTNRRGRTRIGQGDFLP